MSPSKTQSVGLDVALGTAHAFLQMPDPIFGRALVGTILDTATEISHRLGGRGLDTRLPVYAGGWARGYLDRLAPAWSAQYTPELETEALLRLSRAQLTLQLEAVAADIPCRLLFTLPGGATLIDDLTHAHRDSAVYDNGAAARAAAHLALGTQMPNFIGVRILAPRIPYASVHVRSTSERHRIGGCGDCAFEMGRLR